MNLPRSKVETLLELVRRYSPTGAESEATAYLCERMRVLGYEQTFIDEAGNAVGLRGSGERQIVLLGHIDTVRGEIPLRIISPDDPQAQNRLEDEFLPQDALFYGRGAVDAKGPLAAFVDAAAAVDVPQGWQFVVIGAVEEEGDSKGARTVAEKYRPEAVVIGEPSRWNRLTLGYKGSAWAGVTLRRDEAHSAGQEENACEAAFGFWAALRAWEADFNRGKTQIFDQLRLSLRSMSSAGDGFEGLARLEFAARLPLDLSPEEYYARLREIADASGAAPDFSDFAIPAWRAEKNTPLVRAFLAGIRAMGAQPGFVLKSGTADMNVVCPLWRCPALAYGPGDSTLDHTPGEHTSLDEYVRAVAVLEDGLRRLTGNG